MNRAFYLAVRGWVWRLEREIGMIGDALGYRSVLRPSLAVLPIYLKLSANVSPLRHAAVAEPVSLLLAGLFRLLRKDHEGTPGLMDKLLPLLQQKIGRFEADNFDADRFNLGGVNRSRSVAIGMSWRQLNLLFSEQPLFEKTWSLLGDEQSKRWMEDVLAFRILGHLHVRLPTNTAQHWALRDQAKSTECKPLEKERTWSLGKLERFTLAFAGERLVMECSWISVAWTFLFGQYLFERGGVRIQPEPGDRVIDAGSGFGDTALAFAALVGEKGRVWSFDAVENDIVRTNMDLNPVVADRIVFVPRPLGDSADSAPADASRPLPGTISIDEYVEAEGIAGIDFIKMDVEGAELAALRGAEQTIRRCRPKLAISAYHKDEDLAVLPAWIDGLGLGYRFYIDHYTIHYEETILYAIAP